MLLAYRSYRAVSCKSPDTKVVHVFMHYIHTRQIFLMFDILFIFVSLSHCLIFPFQASARNLNRKSADPILGIYKCALLDRILLFVFFSLIRPSLISLARVCRGSISGIGNCKQCLSHTSYIIDHPSLMDSRGYVLVCADVLYDSAKLLPLGSNRDRRTGVSLLSIIRG